MIVFSRLKNLKDLLKEYDAYKSRCIIIFKYSLFASPILHQRHFSLEILLVWYIICSSPGGFRRGIPFNARKTETQTQIVHCNSEQCIFSVIFYII